jgi:hypothetical protein
MVAHFALDIAAGLFYFVCATGKRRKVKSGHPCRLLDFVASA